jgi:hypothetical protein
MGLDSGRNVPRLRHKRLAVSLLLIASRSRRRGAGRWQVGIDALERV